MARLDGGMAQADFAETPAGKLLYVLLWAFARVFSILLLAAAWETLARSGVFTHYQLPALSEVLVRIWNDGVAGDLWINTALTLYRALTAFCICAVFGVLIGMAMSRNAIANWFFDPIISVGFPMPKIAFLPVVILWLGVFDVSKITIIVIDAIFPVIAATVIAIQGVERELIWSARNMGASKREVLTQIVLPAASPQIMTGLQVALAVVADRGGGRRNADGRLWPGRRHDDGLALRQFDRRVRRHRGNRRGRLLSGQGHERDPPPPADLAPGSERSDDGAERGFYRGAQAYLAQLAKNSWSPHNLAQVRNAKLALGDKRKPGELREESMRILKLAKFGVLAGVCALGLLGASGGAKRRAGEDPHVVGRAGGQLGVDRAREKRFDAASRQVLHARERPLPRHAANDHGDRQ